MALNQRQALFVAEYIKDRNAGAAAIRAGYSERTSRTIGPRLLQNVAVRAEVDRKLAKIANRLEISAERVLQERARLAFFDVRKLLDATGKPKAIQDLDDDTAAALAGMDVIEQFEGSGQDRQFVGYLKKYKLTDKGANLERLMKHLGLYERDNEQKTDPLTALLHTIAKTSGNAFVPVVDDPDHLQHDDEGR